MKDEDTKVTVERRTQIHYYVKCPEHGILIDTPSVVVAEEARRQHLALHNRKVESYS